MVYMVLDFLRLIVKKLEQRLSILSSFNKQCQCKDFYLAIVKFFDFFKKEKFYDDSYFQDIKLKLKKIQKYYEDEIKINIDCKKRKLE